MTTYFKKGAWNAICDVCGFQFKSTELRERWDGMRVCLDDYESRHPMDLYKPSFEEHYPEWTRPEPQDVFVGTSPAPSPAPTPSSIGVTITHNISPGGTATGSVLYTITFSAPVIGFTIDDIETVSTTGVVLEAFTTVNASVYEVTVSPGVSVTGTLVVSIAAGAAQDENGNQSVAAASAVVSYDTTS